MGHSPFDDTPFHTHVRLSYSVPLAWARGVSNERPPRPATDRPALEVQAEPQELVPRRRPTQERSRRKFDALLAASRDLLTEVGFESFTCEEVASRADVPIGTLYQSSPTSM